MGDWFYAQEYECAFGASDAQLFTEETLRAMFGARCVPPLFPEG